MKPGNLIGFTVKSKKVPNPAVNPRDEEFISNSTALG